jgi:osmoprotectant transport system permease protein
MDEQQSLWSFMIQQSGKLLEQTFEHIGLTFISLFLSILIGVPLGIWISNKQKYSGWILGFAGILQTIPSIALLGFMIPLLGIGAKPAIVALMLYAFFPSSAILILASRVLTRCN